MKHISLLVPVGILLLSGCVPRIEVAAPKEPITINMNVKIEHEIRITADKNVDALLKNQNGLFNADSGKRPAREGVDEKDSEQGGSGR